MRITVTAKPYAKTASVEETGPQTYTVAIDAPAQDGRANLRLIEIMAEHLHVPKAAIRIVRGQTSRHKALDIFA